MKKLYCEDCGEKKPKGKGLSGFCAQHLAEYYVKNPPTPQPTKEAWWENDFYEVLPIIGSELTDDAKTAWIKKIVEKIIATEQKTCREKLEHLEKAYKKMLAQKETQAQTYKQELRKKISFAAQELWDKGICISKQETESIIRHVLLEEDK